VRDVASQDDAILAALRSGEPSDFDLAQVMPSMRVLDRAEQFMGRSGD
jgi:hypothetical protein